MTADPASDIALALLKAVGMTSDKVTGLTLTLDVREMPRLEVRAYVFDGSEVAAVISRYKLTPELIEQGEPSPLEAVEPL